MNKFPIVEDHDFYFSVETEHFYFDVYKSWNSASGGAMFRAGSYIKKGGGKKYYIDCELFAEWDYQDKQSAFKAAKQWIFDYLERLKSEINIIEKQEVEE